MTRPSSWASSPARLTGPHALRGFATREALVMHVDRSITADQAVTALAQLAATRGGPVYPFRQRPGDDREGADRPGR